MLEYLHQGKKGSFFRDFSSQSNIVVLVQYMMLSFRSYFRIDFSTPLITEAPILVIILDIISPSHWYVFIQMVRTPGIGERKRVISMYLKDQEQVIREIRCLDGVSLPTIKNLINVTSYHGISPLIHVFNYHFQHSIILIKHI